MLWKFALVMMLFISVTAISYAANVTIIAGECYPVNENLFTHMSRAKVYPITTLTGLSRAEKWLLIEHGVIAVDEIMEDRRRLDVLHLTSERIGEVLGEVEGLLALPSISRDIVPV